MNGISLSLKRGWQGKKNLSWIKQRQYYTVSFAILHCLLDAILHCLLDGGTEMLQSHDNKTSLFLGAHASIVLLHSSPLGWLVTSFDGEDWEQHSLTLMEGADLKKKLMISNKFHVFLLPGYLIACISAITWFPPRLGGEETPSLLFFFSIIHMLLLLVIENQRW